MHLIIQYIVHTTENYSNLPDSTLEHFHIQIRKKSDWYC